MAFRENGALGEPLFAGRTGNCEAVTEEPSRVRGPVSSAQAVTVAVCPRQVVAPRRGLLHQHPGVLAEL